MRSHKIRRITVVMIMSVVASMFVLPGLARAYMACDPGWMYDITSHPAPQISTGSSGQAVETKTNYNGTSTTAKMTVTSTVSTTVSEYVSGSISVSSGRVTAMFAKVKATINAGITKTRTDSSGNAMSFNVPAHSYGNGRYGSWREWVVGTSYYLSDHCTESNVMAGVTYKVPINAAGWCVWTRSTAAVSPPVQCQG